MCPHRAPQQLETEGLGLEPPSGPPTGLMGGEDRGDSRARVGTWGGDCAGDATWAGVMEAGAVAKETPEGRGGAAPPLPSLASRSWSRWTRAACWALRVAERWAGSELKPAVSCSMRCSRDNIWRSRSSLRSLSSDMSSYMTLCICGSGRERGGGSARRSGTPHVNTGLIRPTCHVSLFDPPLGQRGRQKGSEDRTEGVGRRRKKEGKEGRRKERRKERK